MRELYYHRNAKYRIQTVTGKWKEGAGLGGSAACSRYLPFMHAKD
jgi:hypothetical protein